MTAIIDYDAGNLRSVEKALISLGETPVITRDPQVICGADRVILPGVGAFGEAMNRLAIRPGARLFEGIEEGAYVYFVHSDYLKAQDEAVVAAAAEYGVSIHASVESGHLFACQFHPEKSGSMGLRILKNFVGL